MLGEQVGKVEDCSTKRILWLQAEDVVQGLHYRRVNKAVAHVGENHGKVDAQWSDTSFTTTVRGLNHAVYLMGH